MHVCVHVSITINKCIIYCISTGPYSMYGESGEIARIPNFFFFSSPPLPHSITQKYYCLNLKDSLTTYTLRNNECDSYNKLFLL